MLPDSNKMYIFQLFTAGNRSTRLSEWRRRIRFTAGWLPLWTTTSTIYVPRTVSVDYQVQQSMTALTRAWQLSVNLEWNERTNGVYLPVNRTKAGLCLANTFTIQIRHVLRGLAYLVFEEETFCDFMSDSLKIIVVFEKSLHESKMILKLCDTFAKRWGVN